MVIANYRRTKRLTGQAFFRTLLKFETKLTRGWPFMKKVPYNILDEAMISAIWARDEVYRRNRDLMAAGQAPRHRLHFASKKNPTQTITIRAQNCKNPLGFYPRLLHTKKMVSVDPDHKRHKHETKPPLHHEHRRRNHDWPNEEGEVGMDSKLQYNRQLKQWTFFWVYGKNAAPPCENQAEVNICAVDPGVRTFLTW